MSGRGCTICIQITKDTREGNCYEEIYLPVALHSPLSVLKQQLETYTHIAFQNQVLILQDLSDPERNNDRLISELNSLTLSQCGIRNNSVLTLHPLGVLPHTSNSEVKKIQYIPEEVCFTVESVIPPEDADHAYNGVMFDVESKDCYEVTLKSVSVAGMLGRVRIFARDRNWEAGMEEMHTNVHWWAHHGHLSHEGWELVADTHCSPSWDKLTTIPLSQPVTLLPHSVRALYVHSDLPDDLGIQYQSYAGNARVGESEHVILHPGLGHTSSEPFDEFNGWYRAYRGLAGVVTYTCRRKGWSPAEHRLFPVPLREAVRCLLLCHTRTVWNHANGGVTPHPLLKLPTHVLYHIMELMHWDWFEEAFARGRRLRQNSDMSSDMEEVKEDDESRRVSSRRCYVS